LSQATQASGSSHSSGSDYQADSGSIPWWSASYMES
jgi:hypothetical protein